MKGRGKPIAGSFQQDRVARVQLAVEVGDGFGIHPEDSRHSPLHGVISQGALIIICEGRKSGRRYDIVVAYFEEGGRLYTFSNSNWSTNFIGGAPVALRLRGRLVRATATVVDDLVLIGRVIQRLARERGEQFAVNLGLIGYGPDGSAHLQIPKNSRVVEFTVTY